MEKGKIKAKGKVVIEWSATFAYAIGLIASDGCLYDSGRHVSFVSKDMEQIVNYTKCLGISPKVGVSISGYKGSKTFRAQISDVQFHHFLESIGIHPHKSKTIGAVKVPNEYFFDFLRGLFDGDGTFYSYWDKRWSSSHMFYVAFASASKDHIAWLQEEIATRTGASGHVTKAVRSSAYQLKYAKKEALAIIEKMYYNPRVVCLSRKRLKIRKALTIERKQQKKYL